jgi:Leucine-rich repeat (LRR) protein
MSENSFTGSLPKSIASLKDLQALNMRSNNIRGSIPKDLSKLTKLKELDLSDNRGISGAHCSYCFGCCSAHS